MMLENHNMREKYVQNWTEVIRENENKIETERQKKGEITIQTLYEGEIEKQGYQREGEGNDTRKSQ